MLLTESCPVFQIPILSSESRAAYDSVWFCMMLDIDYLIDHLYLDWVRLKAGWPELSEASASQLHHMITQILHHDCLHLSGALITKRL